MLACAHVTEVERGIIENMRQAAAEQQALLETANREAADSKDIALDSIAGLKGVAGLAEQMKAAILQFDKEAKVLAVAADAAEKRADESETTIAKKEATILKLWIGNAILGGLCLLLAYLLLKP